jgi:polysaccharide deacetylase 2 family uncharacterized protein YibQ
MAKRPKGGAGSMRGARMVRRHRPQTWHLVFSGFLVCAAILAILYVPWLEKQAGPPPQAASLEEIEPRPAANLRSLANALYTQTTPALEEQGIWPSLVKKTIGVTTHGLNAVDTIYVRVPGDLPLEEVNLQLSKLVRQNGGQVLGAVHTGRGRDVAIHVGLDGSPTTLFTLHQDAKLRRPAGQIALVLDDFGSMSQELAERFCALSQSLTLAILPNEGEVDQILDLARRGGHEVLVHLPMEPENFPEKNPGPDALFISDDSTRVRQLVRRAFRKIPGAVGLNNHMGSRATANHELMRHVLLEVKRRGLLFLDSRTSANSVAFDMALSMEVPTAKRDLFIDPVDQALAIATNLWALADLAAQQGRAIGIGHDREQTLVALEKTLPQLEMRGFRFVTISELAE